MECPVCCEEMEYKDYHEECGLVEYHNVCVNKCYSSSYAYGTTQIEVLGFMTGYHYKTDKKEIELINKAIDAIVNVYKESK